MLGWVVAAVGFHAALAAGFGWLSPPGNAWAPSAPTSASAVVVRRVEPSPPRVAAATAPPISLPAGTSITPGRVARAAAASTIEAAGGPRRYYDITEVDSPAAPQDEWRIDVNQLVDLRTRRLHFEIWIGETGAPERCLVTLIEPPAPAASSSLASQLCSTPMSAAVKSGARVPSVRRIELVLGS